MADTALALPSVSSTILTHAYLQQQLSTDNHTTDSISIIVLTILVAVIFISFVIYFWYVEWHSVARTEREDKKLKNDKQMGQLVENMQMQVKAIVKIPILALVRAFWKQIRHEQEIVRQDSRMMDERHSGTRTRSVLEHRPKLTSSHSLSFRTQKILKHQYHHGVSILFFCLFIISLIIIIITLNTTATDNTQNILIASTFAFILSINLFVVTRQHVYHLSRLEADTDLQFITQTTYDTWNKRDWTNWIQIAILVFEFMQLVAFPLRDLLLAQSFEVAATSHNDAENVAKFQSLVVFFTSLGGLAPSLRTPTWYMYTVWTAFAAVVVSFVVACLVHLVNHVGHRHKQASKGQMRWPMRWVHWFVPVVNVMYIPVLTTFVSSIACQCMNTEGNPIAPTLRCHITPNNPGYQSSAVYLAVSLIGYVIGYLLLTLFLTSFDLAPVEGEIAFKTTGVAFIKNMGLLLGINFLLVEATSTQNRVRGILSILILLTMICYNIRTKPCYINQINYLRTASFTCILWTVVLSAILDETGALVSLSTGAILGIMLSGWLFIIFVFLLIWQWATTSDPRAEQVPWSCEDGKGVTSDGWSAVRYPKTFLHIWHPLPLSPTGAQDPGRETRTAVPYNDSTEKELVGTPKGRASWRAWTSEYFSRKHVH